MLCPGRKGRQKEKEQKPRVSARQHGGQPGGQPPGRKPHSREEGSGGGRGPQHWLVVKSILGLWPASERKDKKTKKQLCLSKEWLADAAKYGSS